eukprot:TCALIF_05373-PA protein Name:"Protein of unknown function" AED:0.48 eAED:0.48 QI:0/0.16/0/0.28/0.83/0.85/7/0/2053
METGFSEDSDYTSDINFPINSQIPNAATSQYLQAANNLQPPVPSTPQKSFESYDSQYFETSHEYPPNGDLNTQQAFNPQEPSYIQSQEYFDPGGTDIPSQSQSGYVINQQEDWNQACPGNGEDGYCDPNYDQGGWYTDDVGEWQQDPYYNQTNVSATQDHSLIQQPQLQSQQPAETLHHNPQNQSGANMTQPVESNSSGPFGFMKSLLPSSATSATTNQVSELNKKNSIVNQSQPQSDYNIPYGNDQADYSSYYENGWFQDEYGQWFQDPTYTKKPEASKGAPTIGQSSYIVNSSDPHQQYPQQHPPSTHQPASSSSPYVVSDSNKNAHQGSAVGGHKKPDNYEEGWYQDESGEWLNEFDWHQDENGEWYYEDSYDYEADGWVQDSNGEWIQNAPSGAKTNLNGSKSMFKNITDLGGNVFGGKSAQQLQEEKEKKAAEEQRQKTLLEQQLRQKIALEQQQKEIMQQRIQLEAEKQKQRQAEHEKLQQEHERQRKKHLEDERKQQMEKERLRQEQMRQQQEKQNIIQYQQHQEKIHHQQEQERLRLQQEQERILKQRELAQEALQKQQQAQQEALRKHHQRIEQERQRQHQQLQNELQRQKQLIQVELLKEKQLLEQEKKKQLAELEQKKLEDIQAQKRIAEEQAEKTKSDILAQKLLADEETKKAKDDIENQKRLAKEESRKAQEEIHLLRKAAEEQAQKAKDEQLARDTTSSKPTKTTNLPFIASSSSLDATQPQDPIFMHESEAMLPHVTSMTSGAGDEKLPTRPADYDDYWYEDEDGCWRNQYDDNDYEYETDDVQPELIVPEPENIKPIIKESVQTEPSQQSLKTEDRRGSEGKNPFSFGSSYIVTDKDVQRKGSTHSAASLEKEPEDRSSQRLSNSSPSNDRRNSSSNSTFNRVRSKPEIVIPRPKELPLSDNPTTADLSQVTFDHLKANQEERLPPRPADYEYYWYQDDDGNWRNEYDDEGFVFADSEYDNTKDEDFYTEEELQQVEQEMKSSVPDYTDLQEPREERVEPCETKTDASEAYLEVPNVDMGPIQSEDESEDYVNGQYQHNMGKSDPPRSLEYNQTELELESHSKERWQWAFHRIVQITRLMPKEMKENLTELNAEMPFDDKPTPRQSFPDEIQAWNGNTLDATVQFMDEDYPEDLDTSTVPTVDQILDKPAKSEAQSGQVPPFDNFEPEIASHGIEDEFHDAIEHPGDEYVEEEQYEGEYYYEEEEEEYYEPEEYWQDDTEQQPEQPESSVLEVPRFDEPPLQEKITPEVTVVVEDNMKQVADEASKAAAEAANVAAEASKNLAKGLSNFGGGLMGAMSNKIESKPSTENKKSSGLFGGASPAKKGFGGFGGFGFSSAKKEETSSGGFGLGGFNFVSPVKSDQPSTSQKKSDGFGFGNMLSNLEGAFDGATKPPQEVNQPKVPLSSAADDQNREQIVSSQGQDLKVDNASSPTKNLNGNLEPLETEEYPEDDYYYDNNDNNLNEEYEDYGEEDYYYEEEEEPQCEEHHIEEPEQTMEQSSELDTDLQEQMKERDVDNFETVNEEKVPSINADECVNDKEYPLVNALDVSNHAEEGLSVNPREDGDLGEISSNIPFETNAKDQSDQNVPRDNYDEEEPPPRSNDLGEPGVGDGARDDVELEQSEEKGAGNLEQIAEDGDVLPEEAIAKPRTGKMTGRERWWWAYMKVRQMNWFFKQGYPPELIDEFMAEQDIYEDQYYEDGGYYDENGDWIDCVAGYEDQEIGEDDYGFNDGQELDPNALEEVIPTEIGGENEEDEEMVPSPPPQSEPQPPAPGGLATKMNGNAPKAANDVIDKDLKAAQDAAKAAGDAAKNLIGGIGGSLLGGFSGGKKSGGFGLGSFLGAPNVPKPSKVPDSKQSVKIQPKDPVPQPKVDNSSPLPTNEIKGEVSEPAKDKGPAPAEVVKVEETEEEVDWDKTIEEPATKSDNQLGTRPGENEHEHVPQEDESGVEMAFREAKPSSDENPPVDIAQEQVPVEVLDAEAEKVVENIKTADSDGEKGTPDGKQVAFAEDGRPKFVKHINKTRTMSGRQKWDWAFEKIIQ